MKSYEGVEV